jgi:biopolymer transport protein ExbD
MIRRRFQNTLEEPNINLTPLIDVVFVILIMFILVAPLLELDQIDLADAAPSTTKGGKAVQENSPIAIHVHRNNTITYNNQTVTAARLTELLKQARQHHPKAKPQLFHDRTAHFGTYQSVKNAAEEAGFQQMDIILKPS